MRDIAMAPDLEPAVARRSRRRTRPQRLSVAEENDAEPVHAGRLCSDKLSADSRD